MQIIPSIVTMNEACRLASRSGPLALVPTMGALHAGHLSLVARARAECHTVVASLFVNPLQFAPGEDFDQYPRQLGQDSDLFAAAGVDLLLAPSADAMYPAGSQSFVDPGPLGDRLDGAHRPGHFRGVATVVAKLFHIVGPARAYFGQKDAVQIAVLRQMIRDLNFPLELIACATVRAPDGLALSSRNAYLSSADRTRALSLNAALSAIDQAIRGGNRNPASLNQLALAHLADIQPEYLALVDPNTLLPVPTVIPGTLIAVAARVGATRLIDNILAP